jgi:urease accessory protein
MNEAVTGIMAEAITPMAETELFDLMSWMSPAWPIGAFAHSGGLEWAVEAGHVTDRDTTFEWVASLVEHGSIHNDIVLFVHAWRAVEAEDRDRLLEVAELAIASQTGFERNLENCAQGAAFRRIAVATAGVSRFNEYFTELSDDQLSYPVAAAALFVCRGIALKAGLTAWLHGSVANLVSAAQRLVPLGQTDGQLVLRDLRSIVIAAAENGCRLPESDPFLALGSCTLLAELGCMAHETQYTRLFRT